MLQVGNRYSIYLILVASQGKYLFSPSSLAFRAFCMHWSNTNVTLCNLEKCWFYAVQRKKAALACSHLALLNVFMNKNAYNQFLHSECAKATTLLGYCGEAEHEYFTVYYEWTAYIMKYVSTAYIPYFLEWTPPLNKRRPRLNAGCILPWNANKRRDSNQRRVWAWHTETRRGRRLPGLGTTRCQRLR